ncbi:MAG: hypothetical protein ABH864_06530 [archaeon]
MGLVRSVHELIDMLHIDRIGREVECVHNMIRENYRVKKYVVSSYEEFQSFVIEYYQYHYGVWRNTPHPFPDEWSRDFARGMIEKRHPDSRLVKVGGLLEQKGGFALALKNAKTGRNGGLVGVIDLIAECLKEDAVREWVKGVFLGGVEPDNFGQRVALMTEYINHYGERILDGEHMMSPYELCLPGNFEYVIESHVRLANEFRKTLQ